MNGNCLPPPSVPTSSNPLSERREIVNLLDAEPTLDYLVQNGVLTSDEVTEISEERDTSRQNRRLLDRVELRKDVSGVQLFTNVLRLTGQHYIANLLDDGERIKALSGSGILTLLASSSSSLVFVVHLLHHERRCIPYVSWLGGSVVERRSLIGELSLVCTGPAADG